MSNWYLCGFLSPNMITLRWKTLHLTGARWTRLSKNWSRGRFCRYTLAKFSSSCANLLPLGVWGCENIYLHLTYRVTGVSPYGNIWFFPFQSDFCCSRIFFFQIPGRFWPLMMMAKWCTQNHHDIWVFISCSSNMSHVRVIFWAFLFFIIFIWGRTHFIGYLSSHRCPTRGCEVIANYLIPYHAYCIHWFK